MRRLLKRLLKYLVYLGAGVVILLAVAVGLFRLFLPRLPEYQDEIKNWASAAIGVRVEFSEMDARWRLRGPELSFYDAELVSRDDLATLLRAEEVSIGVGLLRLLADRELTADRIVIRDATVDVSVDEGGGWYVQGVAAAEFPGFAMEAAGDRGTLSVVGEDIRVEFRRPDFDEPVIVTVDSSQFRRDELQQVLEASVALPASLGERLQLAASKRRAGPEIPWQFFVEGESLDAAGWSRLAPAGWPEVASGAVGVSLWADVGDGRLRSATANFTAADVVAGSDADTAPFAAEGRVEFTRSGDGWLLAADNLQVRTASGAWPETMLQLRAVRDGSEALRTLSGSATYVRLDDLGHVLEWLPAEQRGLLEALAPVGVIRNADFSLSGTEPLAGDFHLSADMERVGFEARDGWPGIRGFSGTMRADQSGGRLEVDAGDAELDLARWLNGPVALDLARGTVVWRRNEHGTTLLSDSIALQNADVATDSSFQATLPAEGGPPVVDVRTRWSVRDVGSVNAYIPPGLVKPALYRWFNDALVAGRISEGTARLAGPLDRFPFDEDEGIFRVEAQVENAVFRYSTLWPAARELSAHVVVDKTRLYSARNSAVNAGNRTVDAQVEIPDLRRPVLHIDAHATGTLETIGRFSRESPIAGVFGGHLERVRAEGRASFDLQLSYPILDRDNYDFSTAISTSGGTLDIEGLAAPITDLTGLVTVSRDDIVSESLQGRFLGEQVALELERAAPESPYSAVLTGRGTVGDRGLADHLGTPFADALAGSTSYVATVRFPRAGAAEPRPLDVAIDSDLEGMGIHLPAPAGKEPGAVRRMSLVIAFPEEDRIESHGHLTDDIRWNLRFTRRGVAGWDFERGTVALGGIEPGIGDTRGLHIEGELPALDIDEWLALGNRDGGRANFGERVRSVDVVAGELTVLGRQLARHHLTVDRSALDWVVRIDGENAVGAITLPYDFAGERPLHLDMEKLLLPATDDDEADRPQDERQRDPRTLPAVTVRASEFALGQRRFGRLRLDVKRTGAGLAGEVETTSDNFYISGTAGWLADETDATGQRSFIDVQLVSSNVEQTMRELDYLSGVESESLLAEVDLSWSGGFGGDFLPTLNGTVTVEFGTGQLDDLEPGAGRVFGLMSIVALPRRLALDFRDVFDRGFGFDAITGTFRLVDGEAYTCDLSLKGPAADVGIVGRAGLVDEQYEQAAVVSANVGNTLPVVGAVVAGPQVAAALLIFSQIFKKPLQEMGQIYYTIEGPWDDPVIDSADAPRFAEAGALAGCLQAAE